MTDDGDFGVWPSTKLLMSREYPWGARVSWLIVDKIVEINRDFGKPNYLLTVSEQWVIFPGIGEI